MILSGRYGICFGYNSGVGTKETPAHKHKDNLF